MPKTKTLTIDDIELENVKGIGDTIAKKLREAGILSVLDLSTSNASDLAISAKTTKEAAIEHIANAQKILRDNNIMDQLIMDSSEALKQRESILKITTGSEDLDKWLLGGVETKAITEFFGEFGTGKSQICHALALNALASIEDGGLNGNVLYIDTEGTYRPERIAEMAITRKMKVEDVLPKIFKVRLFNASALEAIIKEIGRYIEQYKVKLIIVDSITSLHRAESSGMSDLAVRYQHLNAAVNKLKRVADIYNIAVVETNQVVAIPAQPFGDPLKPVGGNIIGHNSTYRIKLRRSGKNRIATMIDSPNHIFDECMFSITNKGIENKIG